MTQRPDSSPGGQGGGRRRRTARGKDECPVCGEGYTVYRLLDTQLVRAPRIRAPESFAAQLRARIARSRSRRKPVLFKIAAPALGAVAIVLAALWWQGDFPVSLSGPQSAGRSVEQTTVNDGPGAGIPASRAPALAAQFDWIDVEYVLPTVRSSYQLGEVSDGEPLQRRMPLTNMRRKVPNTAVTGGRATAAAAPSSENSIML